MAVAGRPGETGADAQASAGRRRHLHLVRRASWNLVDQMLSALTNMVLAVVVVHAAGAEAFDAFSVVFLLFATAIGVERALVGQPLLIRHSADTGHEARRTVSRAMGLVLGFTVPAALLMLGTGLALGGQLGATLIATCAVLPFLIMQDAARHAFFARSEARKAAFNDALWAVVQFSAMAVLVRMDAATAPNLVLAWGGAAAVCVVVALVQLRAFPNPLAAVGWLRQHRDQVGFLLGEYMLSTGAFNGGYLTVGAIIGDEAVGSIRAAQVLLGPLQIISGAVMSFGLPELARRAESMANRTRARIALITTASMAGLSIVYGGALFLVPDVAGELLFRAKWDESREVLLPLALAMVASTSALGPALVIFSLGQARKIFRIMTVEAPMVFTLMIGGTLLFGVRGAAWGQFIDQFVVIFLFYATLRRVLAAYRPAHADASPIGRAATAVPRGGTPPRDDGAGPPAAGPLAPVMPATPGTPATPATGILPVARRVTRATATRATRATRGESSERDGGCSPPSGAVRSDTTGGISQVG